MKAQEKQQCCPCHGGKKVFPFLLEHAWQKVGGSNSCKPSNDNLGVAATQEIEEGATCLNVCIYLCVVLHTHSMYVYSQERKSNLLA